MNRNIVIAAAKGITAHKNPSLLKDYGGTLDLGKKWVESLLLRRGYVKRKATKAATKLPSADFPDIKLSFLRRILEEVQSHAIPMQLLFNCDQTGVKLVPMSSWTMAQGGSKQVLVVGVEDKREITLVLAVTVSGML